MLKTKIVEILKEMGLDPLPMGDYDNKWLFYSQTKKYHFAIPFDATEEEVRESAKNVPMMRCATCGSIISEDKMSWDNEYVPMCPVCFTEDMLFEIPNDLPFACPYCGMIEQSETKETLQGSHVCPHCYASLYVPETVVVTRHPALIECLKEKGLINENTKILTHATKKDIEGKNVIGILPIDLAVYTNSITSVTMNLTEAHRGKELTLEDMKEIVGTIKTYKVREVQ